MTKSAKDVVEFTLLFNRYKVKVYNYVVKMISDKMAAEDIVQNVFLKLFERMDTIRNKNSISYWIFTTVRNEVYMFIRSKKIKADQFNVADTDELEVQSGEDISAQVELNETKNLIMQELNNMPNEQKEVFILKEYSGFSYKEISALLKIDGGLVKSRLFKARQKLIGRLSSLVN